MRPSRALLVVMLAAAACGKHEETAKKVDEPAAPPAAPPPRPIAACERYAAALAKAGDLDVDPEVRDLLRDEAALVRAASRAPRDADRDELTMRCATGLLDLGRVPTDMYGVGGVIQGGGVAGGTPTTVPACQRLFAIFDRLAACPDLPDAIKDTYKQARTMMLDAWGQMPQDQDTRDMMARACQTAADTYGQILSQSRCP